MTDTPTFTVQINGGHEQSLAVKTGQYTLAAIAALALLDYEQADDYDVVKIWVPDLIDGGYGPYFIAWDGHTRVQPADSRRW